MVINLNLFRVWRSRRTLVFIFIYKRFTLFLIKIFKALCPNCHRKIHLAVDSERKHMINLIYNARKGLLAKKELVVTLRDLYKYYKIDE